MRFILPLILSLSFLLSWNTVFPYYFGKNKIQFNKKHWQIYQTEHFNIYLDKTALGISATVGKILEESYDYLADFYGHDIKIVIPIIVFNSSLDFANNNIIPEFFTEATGGFTEIIRNRIVLPFNGNWPEFSHVLTHELNHAFQFSIVYGHSELISSPLSGQTLGSRRQPPLWFMEGLSEYLTIGLDKKANMYLKDGIITGALPSVMEMEKPYRLGQRYYYVYKGAQGFFDWIDKTYGREKLKHFIHYMLKVGISEVVFKNVLGLSVAQANELWFRYLQKKYWKEIPNINTANYLMQAQGTFHLNNLSTVNINPVFSTNTNEVYLINNKDIYTKIVRYNLSRKIQEKTIASTQVEEMYENISVLHNALSTDKTGELLLFTSRAGKHFIFNLYNTKKNRLVKRIPVLFSDLYSAKISPNGSNIVFAAQKNGKIDLFVLNVTSQQIAQLTDNYATERTPNWSADGKSVLYASNKKFSPYSPYNNLFKIHLDTKQATALTTGKHIDLYPAYSFDGKKLAFVSDRNSSPNLYIKHEEDGVIYQITDVTGGVSAPAWSLDNNKIAYSKFHSGGYDVFYTDVQLNNPKYAQRKFSENDFKENLDQTNAYQNANDDVSDDTNRNSSYNGIIPRLTYEPITKNALPSTNTALPHNSLSVYQPLLMIDNIFFYLGGSSSGTQGGFLGGGTFALADLLKEHHLYINSSFAYTIGFNVFDTDTTIQYLNVHNRLNYGFYARIWQYHEYFFIANNRYQDRSDINLRMPLNNYATYAHLEYQVGTFLQYPFNKFNRLNLGFTPLWVSRNKGRNTQYVKKNLEEINKYGLTFNLSYTHDSTLLGFLHPIDNERSFISVEYGPSFGSPILLDYVKLYADLRKYLFLNTSSSVAVRLINGAIFGKDKKYFDFVGGGGPIHQNYPHVNAYNFGSIRGSFLHLLNLEYRLVLLSPYNLPAPLAILFGQVSGVAFYDIGTAYSDVNQFTPWSVKNNTFMFEDIKASFGLGLRWVLIFFPVKLNFSLPHLGNRLGDKWNVFFFIGYDY